VLGRVVDRAEVHLYSEGLSGDAIRDAQLRPVGDLGRTILTAVDRLGPSARVAVLPEGPLTVATVRA